MGVRGLKKYIEENNLLKRRNFKGSKLIIDGCNLSNTLYEYTRFDLKHGGDYYAYEILIKKFFETLKNCNIEPYVILDGGTDHTNKKLETLKKRAQQRIKMGKKLSVGQQCYSDGLKPALLSHVFKQILAFLKIPFIQCLEEADWEIAALANQWDCPVLSNDSDFFIFDLKAGVLPITHFKWEKVSSQKFIPAKIFLISNICNFCKLNKQLLPVFAALAGNDYVNLNGSFNWEKYSSSSGPHAHLDGMLCWLSKFANTDTTIRALLDLLDDQRAKNKVQSALMTCIGEYELTKSNVAQFFLKGVAPRNLPKALQVLPNWIRVPLFEGKMSSSIIDVLVLQSVRLSFQVEDFDCPSSSAISRPIRQVLYGLLLSGQKQRDDRKPILAHVDPEACYVEEYDREGVTLTTFWVKPACPFSGKDLHLKTLNEAPRELRLQVFFDTLGVTKPISSPIADKFQFPVFVTCYWLQNANPCPCLEHLWALLLGFVFGELSVQRKSETGVALVWNRLDKLRLHTTAGGPDLHSAHTYSQWQACMRDTIRLSRLLCLTEPELARLYCGPLVHQAALMLMSGATPESFLSGGAIPLKLFRDLQQAVRDCLEDGVWERLQKASPQVRRERRRAHTVGNLEELARQFEQMCDDEDDYDYGCGRKGKARSEDEKVNVQIRTRHKKKSRALRDHSPGKLKKRDRVIWA